MSNEAFGVNGYTLPELSNIISKLLGLPAVHRDNTYWGDYYKYESDPDRGNNHILVWNEIPPRCTDPDEAAEPAFLDYKCIFWTAQGHESAEMRQALLAIPGAKLLRERDA